MLPQKQPLELMQTTWAQQLNPIIANPVLQNNILKNISLSAGDNVINHKLGRKLQGWRFTRVRAAATTYDKQDSNKTPELTLVLNSSADVVVDIEVF